MNRLDWIVLCTTLLFIVVYGIWKSRGQKNLNSFLLGSREAKWWMVGLSVMATQASAITFLSTPGQAYSDGMRFVQFYFGLPLAMVILCITFIPIYYKLKVYTAYEFLESRFNVKTRSLAAFLFLIQRGLGAGITIFAPAIILSSIMGWNLKITNLAIGTMVILYTVSGGSKAVNQTQKLQMLIIMTGMFIAFFILLDYIPEGWSLGNALSLAGAYGRMDVVDFSIDFNSRYTFWSGITGGLFLALAYFGTDQSQVQRYLTGSSIKESRLGLIFNGLLKVPLQFFILLTGIMVFIFFQFHRAPIFFNQHAIEKVYESEQADALQTIESTYDELLELRENAQTGFLNAIKTGNQTEKEKIAAELNSIFEDEQKLREDTKELITMTDPSIETNDRDYVFLNFIINHLPKGLVGLLLAVIFSAAMSSTAAELNALASTTTIDFYKRFVKKEATDRQFLTASKGFTLFWGLVAIAFALFGTLAENLIQFVNIVGSLFYGTILGIFLSAFYIKRIKGNAIFIAAIAAEIIVFTFFFITEIGYLWYNVIGCMSCIFVALILQSIMDKTNHT